MKKFFCVFASIFLVFFILYNLFSSNTQASNISKEDEYYYNDNSLNGDKNSMKPLHTGIIDTVKDSLTVVVNKQFSLPADYIPEDLVVPDVLFNFNHYDEKKLLRQVAATALEDLFNAAKKEGLTFYAISGYRSYDRQKQIYDSNIATKGAEYTNRYSAMPGHSEHQTGLSMDVSTTSIGNRLEPVFAYTPEGKWLAKNAHKFGFIIRYPKEKEELTGYSYEPWHVRYVGIEMAKYLYEKQWTLEDYYGLDPYDFDYATASYDSVTDVDTSTDKKELTQPTKEEIDKVSKSAINDNNEKDSKKQESKKDDKNTEKEKSNKTEKPGNNKTEKPSDNKTEKPSDNKAEKPSDNNTEKPSDNKPEKPGDNKPEKPDENKPEKPSDNNTEKPGDNNTEEPGDDTVTNPDENNTNSEKN